MSRPARASPWDLSVADPSGGRGLDGSHLPLQDGLDLR